MILNGLKILIGPLKLLILIVVFSINCFAGSDNKVVRFPGVCDDALSSSHVNEQHEELIKKLEMVVNNPKVRVYYFKRALKYADNPKELDEEFFGSRFSVLGIRQFWKALSMSDRELFVNEVLPSTKRVGSSRGDRLQNHLIFRWLAPRSKKFSFDIALNHAFSTKVYSDLYMARQYVPGLPGVDEYSSVDWDSEEQKKLYEHVNELVLAMPATDGGVTRTLEFLVAVNRLYSETDFPNVNTILNSDMRDVGNHEPDTELYNSLQKSYRPFFKFISLNRWTSGNNNFQNRLLRRASQFPPVKRALDGLISSALIFLGSSPGLPVNEMTRVLLRPLIFINDEPAVKSDGTLDLAKFLERMNFSLPDPEFQAGRLLDHIRRQLVSIYLVGEYYFQLSNKSSDPNYKIHTLFKEFRPDNLERPLTALRAISVHTLMKPMWATLKIDEELSAVLSRMAVEDAAVAGLLSTSFSKLFPSEAIKNGAEVQDVRLVEELRERLLKKSKETLKFDRDEWMEEYYNLTFVNPFTPM